MSSFSEHPPTAVPLSRPAVARRILFLCSRNKRRSATAEALFAEHSVVEVDSAGLSDDAVVPVTRDQVEWADVILVMEPVHRQRLSRKFGRLLAGKRVVVLGIRDDYEYMEPSLVRLLQTKCAPFIPAT